MWHSNCLVLMTYAHLFSRSRHADCVLTHLSLLDHQSWRVVEPDTFPCPIPQDPHPPPPLEHPPPPLEQPPPPLPPLPHPPLLQPPLESHDPHTSPDTWSFTGTWIITPLSSITSTDSLGTLIETTLP